MTLDILDKLLRFRDDSYLQIFVNGNHTIAELWVIEGVDEHKKVIDFSGVSIADALTQMDGVLAQSVEERAIESFWIRTSEEPEEEKEEDDK